MFRLSDIDGLLLAMSNTLESTQSGLASQILETVSVSWIVLNVPMAFLGFIYLILPTTLSKRHEKLEGQGSQRTNPKASELEEFLDSFFRREELAAAIHELAVDGSVKPIRFFKGGSNALTLLAEVESELVVRKIVSREHQQKLREQYSWLQKHGHLEYVVSPVRELSSSGSYMFDLEFLDAQDMFSWLHRSPLAISEDAITSLLSDLKSNLYMRANSQEIVGVDLIQEYLESWIYRRIVSVEAASPELNEIINSPHVRINGVNRNGLRKCLDLILTNPISLEALASCRTTESIHGDLTIDNMMVDESGRILIIDPDQNTICSPVIDYSRILQSLEGGYEFLNQIDEKEVSTIKNPETDTWEICYPVIKSGAYESLAIVVRDIARKELSPSELSTLDLHVGLFFVRMLTHRLRISRHTTPVYLATAIVFLERYIKTNGIQ
jgi:hypothetical protein